jgi:hypothetical protein
MLASLLWVGSTAPAVKEPVYTYNFCDTENFTWQGGEEITYTLYYQLNFIWIPAGEATIKVKDMGDRYFISVDGKTISAFEWFYEVNDRYESVIDKRLCCPFLSPGIFMKESTCGGINSPLTRKTMWSMPLKAGQTNPPNIIQPICPDVCMT